MSVTNCHSNDAAIAALEAEAVQRMNQRSNDDKTYHFLFSFREGERPSPDILLDCEEELCRVLGFAEHQRVSVVHHDTNNLHVHVAVNKIHPTRLTIHTPFNDHWVLSRAAERLEVKHNLQRDKHKPRASGIEPGGAAADMERHSGIESFTGWIQRQVADELCRAGSWAELHLAAQRYGLEIRLRGNGAVFTQGEHQVRASSVRRELSLNALQKRLGTFEPAPVLQPGASSDRTAAKAQAPRVGDAPPPHLRGKHTHPAAAVDQRTAHVTAPVAAVARPSIEELQHRSEDWSRLIAQLLRERASARAGESARAAPDAIDARRQYNKRPVSETAEASKLFELYLRDRAQREVVRRERSLQLRRDQQAEFERVIQRWRLSRAALRLVTGSRAEKQFMHAAARLAMRQELKALRERAARDRRALAHATKRMAWSDWLLARGRTGNIAALEELRRCRSVKNPSPEGQRALAGQPVSVRAQGLHGVVDTVTKTGVVVYGGSLTGVRDDGHRLRVTGRVSHAVLAEALRVAANRYGAALCVDGDDAFKQAVVDVAVARNIEVTFDDAILDARRQAQQAKETHRGRGIQPGRDNGRAQLRKQSRPTGLEAAAGRKTSDREDGLRNVRVGELVRDGEGPQRVLRKDVSAHLAGRSRQSGEALRRAVGAARDIGAAPPPFRRGRLRSLSTLTGPLNRAKEEPSASVRRGKRTKRNDVATNRPIAPRTAIPSLGSVPSPSQPIRTQLMRRTTSTIEEAIAHYVAEREAKRARGMSDVLLHVPFDGRSGEFTFVGRRSVDGHTLLLLRDSTRIIVLPAQQQSAALRSGDHVTVGPDGTITSRSQGRRR